MGQSLNISDSKYALVCGAEIGDLIWYKIDVLYDDGTYNLIEDHGIFVLFSRIDGRLILQDKNNGFEFKVFISDFDDEKISIGYTRAVLIEKNMYRHAKR